MSKVPPIFFIDGGLGTTLADHYGCIFDDSTPLWSSQLLLSAAGSETLRKCHSAFADAGADFITTATYQASVGGFHESLLSIEKTVKIQTEHTARAMENGKSTTLDQELETEIQQATNLKRLGGYPNHETFLAQKCMRKAVKLARMSFKGRIGSVVLGLGAAGACLRPSQEYTGNYADSEVGTSISSIRKWHLGRLHVFCDAKFMSTDETLSGSNCWNEIDLIAFETIPLVHEVIAVREAMFQISYSLQLEDVASKKDFWISCVFPGDGYCLPDGSSITEAMRSMLGKRKGAAVPIGVGINCTFIGKLESLVEKYEVAITEMIAKGEVEKWPSLVIYPDGTNGEVYNTTTHEWEKKEGANLTYESWDRVIYEIVNKARYRGAWQSIYVGGCCRTTPDDIRKLRMNWNSS
ncbi:hypothetical protein K3495_g2018 [Podosphaera aphanis]|nr:hypothetical protein K3495_g2018 [Podosphaera aphanis]